MRLSELKTGETGIIIKILGHGAFRKRVMEMGFVKGRPVEVVLHAPLKDPIKYSIMGYNVSLRASEAHMIEVVKLEDNQETTTLRGSGVITDCNDHQSIVDRERHTINIALIGNPNCGKTSLFNIASGSSERVGNYSGVTVDAKSGKFEHRGYRFNIVDLPGTYSLASYSPEELYVRRYLRDYTPDVIINVVDASNIERNLYLTTELIDMDRSMVIALNMYDELRARGTQLDYKMLGEMIGVPMIPVVARSGEGIDRLFDTVISVFEGKDTSVRHIHVSLGADIEIAVRKLIDKIKADGQIGRHFSPRYIAIKLLEGDMEAEDLIKHSPAHRQIMLMRDELRAQIESISDEDISSTVAAEKYGFIAGALAETMVNGKASGNPRTSLLDSLVTNKLFGFPIFFAVMFLIFWATFAIGQYPMDWIDNGVAWLSSIIQKLMPDGILKDLIADGIIGGVGGVIVFLPNILILYFCISFMEDSGYMARAAFIMDKVMHRIGLHGKSFIPLIMGFGCNVPAIISTRAIESRSSRIITILINPFMSCSARLPIYVLLIGTFFPSHATLVFMALYILGIIVAVITAKLLRRFMFKTDETPFVMELPPYRLPTMKASLRHTWAKGVQYLKKMGGTILVASIIVWALNYFPRHDEEVITASLQTEYVSDSSINPSSDSYLEMMGKAINPLMEPIGFHWRASVAALAGVPAKEIVVSTLGVLYTGDEASSTTRLSQRLTTPNPTTGKPDFTPAAALGFLVFILLYCPCIATVTAIARETGTWKWGLFSVVYNTVAAWIVAFAVYRIALLF
ncbi:MAG: ferrous iron transport protein B [Muribaculaceae bacterium]|nr:ferrous iron transport protein B [Muribaculaceae bacterium]